MCDVQGIDNGDNFRVIVNKDFNYIFFLLETNYLSSTSCETLGKLVHLFGHPFIH